MREGRSSNRVGGDLRRADALYRDGTIESVWTWANPAEAVRAQLTAQFEQIRFEHRLVCLVFGDKCVEHRRERMLFGNELPHSRCDRVEAEVHTTFQIQRHRFAVELAEQH